MDAWRPNPDVDPYGLYRPLLRVALNARREEIFCAVWRAGLPEVAEYVIEERAAPRPQPMEPGQLHVTVPSVPDRGVTVPPEPWPHSSN